MASVCGHACGKRHASHECETFAASPLHNSTVFCGHKRNRILTPSDDVLLLDTRCKYHCTPRFIWIQKGPFVELLTDWTLDHQLFLSLCWAHLAPALLLTNKRLTTSEYYKLLSIGGGLEFSVIEPMDTEHLVLGLSETPIPGATSAVWNWFLSSPPESLVPPPLVSSSSSESLCGHGGGDLL